jgi:hypothetical protein
MGDRTGKKKKRNSAPGILEIKTKKLGQKKRSSKTASQSTAAPAPAPAPAHAPAHAHAHAPSFL